MRELDFSEGNLWNRWLGVKAIWEMIQGEVTKSVKVTLERVLKEELRGRVGCGRYERNDRRRDQRNGSYGRALLTQYGWIDDLRVPRPRHGGLDSQILVRYQRRQRLVDRVLLEAFLRGHSTRQTRRVFAKLFGESVSAPTVSRILTGLDKDVVAFHRRPLKSEYEWLYLDGYSITLRKPVKQTKVILLAWARTSDGKSELVDFLLTTRESESSWWGFLTDLKERGLKTIPLVISDGHPGLIKAITMVWPRAGRQRCVIHKVDDAVRHSDRKHQLQLRRDALWIFEKTATTESEVRRRLRTFCGKWRTTEPRAVAILLKDIADCFTYLSYPQAVQKTLKSTNPIERQIEELRRRLIPMRSFNNTRSVERITYGLIAYVLNKPDPDMPIDNFTQDA